MFLKLFLLNSTSACPQSTYPSPVKFDQVINKGRLSEILKPHQSSQDFSNFRWGQVHPYQRQSLPPARCLADSQAQSESQPGNLQPQSRFNAVRPRPSSRRARLLQSSPRAKKPNFRSRHLQLPQISRCELYCSQRVYGTPDMHPAKSHIKSGDRRLSFTTSPQNSRTAKSAPIVLTCSIQIT